MGNTNDSASLTKENLRNRQTNHQYFMTQEQSSLEANTPYIEYVTESFKADFPYMNQRILAIIRAEQRNFTDEENYLKNVNHFSVCARKMRTNKRYDYILDICNNFLNSRHILGVRLPKNPKTILYEGTVIELIQDPVLNFKKDMTKIYTRVDQFDPGYNDGKEINPLILRELIKTGAHGMDIFRVPQKSLESVIDSKLNVLFESYLLNHEKVDILKFSRPHLEPYLKNKIDLVLNYPGMFSQVKSEQDIAKEKQKKKDKLLIPIQKIEKIEKDQLGRPLEEQMQVVEEGVYEKIALEKKLTQIRIQTSIMHEVLSNVRLVTPGEDYSQVTSSKIYEETFLQMESKNQLQHLKCLNLKSTRLYKKKIKINLVDGGIGITNLRSRKILIRGLSNHNTQHHPKSFNSYTIQQLNFPTIIMEQKNPGVLIKFNLETRECNMIYSRGSRDYYCKSSHIENQKYLDVDRSSIGKNQVWRIQHKYQPLYQEGQDSLMHSIFCKKKDNLIFYYRINDGEMQPLYKDIGLVRKGEVDVCEKYHNKKVKMYCSEKKWQVFETFHSPDLKHTILIYKSGSRMKFCVFKVLPKINKMFLAGEVNFQINDGRRLLHAGFIDENHFIILSIVPEYFNLNRDDPLDRPKSIQAIYKVQILRINELETLLTVD